MSTFHPTMPILPGKKLKLDNVSYKLNFISAAEEIKKLLLSFPPKISICDVNDTGKPCLAQTILDLKRLFDHKVLQKIIIEKNNILKIEYNIFFIFKFDNQYEAILMDSDKKNIGILDVTIRLEDNGPYYRTKNRVCGKFDIFKTLFYV